MVQSKPNDHGLSVITFPLAGKDGSFSASAANQGPDYKKIRKAYLDAANFLFGVLENTKHEGQAQKCTQAIRGLGDQALNFDLDKSVLEIMLAGAEARAGIRNIGKRNAQPIPVFTDGLSGAAQALVNKYYTFQQKMSDTLEYGREAS